MFIAVDGLSTNVPDDVKKMPPPAKNLGGGPEYGNLEGGVPGQGGAGSESDLDRWDVQSHQYSTKADVETSILARLLSGSAKASNYGLVQEAKRFCIQTSENGRRVEFGTAVRLSVAVLSTDFNLSLTLPNIAAKAQISNLQARISLSVDGYVGPLGEMLPAPDNLNVENLNIYTTAFKSIQAMVFGQQGLTFISPTLLGYHSKDDPKAA
jgi:hypothetical protein